MSGIIIIGIITACLTVSSGNSWMKGPGVAAEPRQRPYALEYLQETEETDKFILVEGGGGSDVLVSCYEKNQDAVWNQIFSVSGMYGRNGGSYSKKEGDGKTPLGIYQLTMTFGQSENPGSRLPYHKIQKGDYWVDDINSQYYNQLVQKGKGKRDWKSAENMAAVSDYYNYGLVLDYNSDCIPGLGSAIFLHCSRESDVTGSAGCIRIPEPYVKQLIGWVEEDTKIIIVSETVKP